MSKTYQETLDSIFEMLPMFHRVGASAYKNDLTNTIKLCAALGNPENAFPSIHIAGTNGKGSTTHLIASMLQEAGLKVGVYTSPHYKDFRERIKINGVFISENEVVDFIEKQQSLIQEIQPSFFEVTVAMAFDFFRNHNVDIAVVEVGMGGRLDSTNVISPLLSVITNIGYDHMQFLGNTLEKIAEEKAGIIKENTPVIIGEKQVETTDVFIEKSNAKNAPILFAEEETKISEYQNTLDIQAKNIQIHAVQNPLGAAYQLKNIRTAITAFTTFYKLHASLFNITDKSVETLIQKGIEQVFDSAHNEHGLKPVLEQVSKIPCQKLHIVYGTVSDKDLSKVFPILPSNALYYCCAANIPRAMNAEVLCDFFTQHHFKATAFTSVEAAYKKALEDAASDDVILVIGSIFIIGELI